MPSHYCRASTEKEYLDLFRDPRGHSPPPHVYVGTARFRSPEAAPDEEQPPGKRYRRRSPHFHLQSTQGAGRTCRLPTPRSSSHEAVAASNVQHSITILESI